MKRQGWMQGRVRMLALTDAFRDLLHALIEAVHEVDDRYDNHEERIRALEAKARDYQEDGDLAVEADYGHEAGMLYALQQRAETAERERDEALRSRDHVVEHEATELAFQRARADAARAALAKIVAIDGEDLRIKCTFGGGLKESKAIATAALNANHS